MPYQFVSERQDYTDLSSGRVFYSQPGFPAFPVRLASELLQRCLNLREKVGGRGPCRIYDPCCGGAYHLVSLAFLHWDAIGHITASDIDPAGSRLSDQNLSLLTLAGMDRRIAEIARMQAQFGKESHAGAFESATRLRAALLANLERREISTTVFSADALSAGDRIALHQGEIDVLLTDLPYGRHTAWKTSTGQDLPSSPAEQMLQTLLPLITSRSVLGLCSDKAQKVAHPAFRRAAHFQVGKRQVILLVKL
jgi:uncharacterized small protein (DUF1192 family)